MLSLEQVRLMAQSCHHVAAPTPASLPTPLFSGTAKPAAAQKSSWLFAWRISPQLQPALFSVTTLDLSPFLKDIEEQAGFLHFLSTNLYSFN